ncbi:receptor activity-modifying protein 1-like [Colossoma macropomum]|uniref:receptor activity-modifying protein 1-like n=1 Tax=Colossoma macropomum TaxID=42526 RepID=UPI00186409E5|nr:receptor activity-modifying protein 1-like [Colossoma macropomum]
MLAGLLLLLLEVPLTWGQTAEGTLLGYEDNSTTQSHKAFNFSANGTFLIENADHNVTQESFQNQKNIYNYRHCNETLLMMNVEICWYKIFHPNMTALGEENWCNWDLVIGYYTFLTLCLEHFSEESYCYFPGPIIQKLFVDIHKQYFSSCSTTEEDFPNSPLSVVLILTLLPVSIIPIAVFMVIWKNNVKD